MKKFWVLVLSFQVFFALQSFAQKSSPSYRSAGQMDANNIKTIFTNAGVIGQPSNIGPMVSWKYLHNGYFGDLSILIGVELPVKDYTGDGIPDILHEVIITPVNRPGGGNTNGINGQFGGFEPDSGYFNPNLNVTGEGVAISNLPETWPTVWPDHPEYGSNAWDGFFGKDSLAGDQEAYFQMDDREDAKFYKLYKFLPDPSDTTRYGFGITVNVRYIELKNPLFQDVLFRVYDIKNESKYNYSKVVFGNLAGTYIGGTGDEYNDDVVYFDSTNNIIYGWDKEPGLGIPYVRPVANPYWQPNPYAVGTTGETFLQSPNNNKISGYDYFVPAGAINMAGNIDMWNKLTKLYPPPPGDTLYGEDGDYLYGSNVFPLNSGETKRIASVLIFGNNKTDVLNKSQLAQILWYNNFNINNIYSGISLQGMSKHISISGTQNIQWTSKNSGGFVDIWYSSDAGGSWTNVVRDAPNNGTYSWNTSLFKDCSFGKLKIIIKDNNKNMYGINESNYFSVNNTGNASPFTKILNTEFDSSNVFTDLSHNFKILVGDNKSDSLLCKVYYNFATDTNYYFSQQFYVHQDTSAQTVPVNFNDIPNFDLLRIKLEVVDGAESFSDATPFFNKQTPRQYINTSNYNKVSGYAQVPIKIVKVDPAHFTGDDYQITFDDTTSNSQKTFSVYDLTKKNYVLKNSPLIPFAESPVFDGLSLYTEDVNVELDTIKSHWSRLSNNNLTYTFLQPNFLYSLNIKTHEDPFDYMLVFSNSYNDTSNSLSTVLGTNSLVRKKVNFRLYDITNKNSPVRIQFGFVEYHNIKVDTLSNLDVVYLSNANGSIISWYIAFFGADTANVPAAGDTLFLYTTKGITHYDTLDIFGLPADVKPTKQLPVTFSLDQNYPNPFNPATIIQYSIPKTANVSLKVYDILGREITTLVNGERSVGTYKAEFNAGKFSSGVYFYQLRAGDFVSTKKMILLK